MTTAEIVYSTSTPRTGAGGRRIRGSVTDPKRGAREGRPLPMATIRTVRAASPWASTSGPRKRQPVTTYHDAATLYRQAAAAPPVDDLTAALLRAVTS